MISYNGTYLQQKGLLPMRLFISVICFFLSTATCLHAAEISAFSQSLITKKVDVPELDLVYLELKNGMKVYLKRTKDNDGIQARLTALGGYAELPLKERSSAFIASKALLQSGLGKYSSEKLFSHFYEHSINLDVEILPFGRHVEGCSSPESVDMLLGFMQLFFLENRLENEAFEKARQHAVDKLLKKKQEAEEAFDEAYLAFNAPELMLPGKFSLEDLKNAELTAAQTFVQRAFKNPADFSAVIVGPFQLSSMIELVERYLGAIPESKNSLRQTQKPRFSIAETGIRTKPLRQTSKNDEYFTAITFPVKVPIDNNNFSVLEDAVILLRKRLKQRMRTIYGMETVLYLSLEHPLYPQMTTPWIKVLYVSSAKQISPMGQTVLLELKNMQSGLPTASEIDKVHRKHKKAMHTKAKDNTYWLFLLSNYATKGWDPQQIPENLRSSQDRKHVDKMLQTAISLDCYTVFSL